MTPNHASIQPNLCRLSDENAYLKIGGKKILVEHTSINPNAIKALT